MESAFSRTVPSKDCPGESFKGSRHFFFSFYHYCKKKKHFKKIFVSRQFSTCEIGNFGTDQLRETWAGYSGEFHAC